MSGRQGGRERQGEGGLAAGRVGGGGEGGAEAVGNATEVCVESRPGDDEREGVTVLFLSPFEPSLFPLSYAHTYTTCAGAPRRFSSLRRSRRLIRPCRPSS